MLYFGRFCLLFFNSSLFYFPIFLGEIDAVCIIPIARSRCCGDQLVLISQVCFLDENPLWQQFLNSPFQFRPPTGDYCLEFPAGLVDNNETPEEAALRELKV